MYKICSYWEEAAVWHRELSSVLCDDLEGLDVGGMGGRLTREGIYVMRRAGFTLLYSRNNTTA